MMKIFEAAVALGLASAVDARFFDKMFTHEEANVTAVNYNSGTVSMQMSDKPVKQ